MYFLNLFNVLQLLKIFILPFCVLFLNIFLDFVLHIYTFWPWFDIPMHFIGGASIGFGTLMAFRILWSKGFLQNTPVLFSLFLLISIVALAAVLWEFVEFIADWLLSSRFSLGQLQGGLGDTMGDLFFGLLGGTLFGLYALIVKRGSILDNLE